MGNKDEEKYTVSGDVCGVDPTAISGQMCSGNRQLWWSFGRIGIGQIDHTLVLQCAGQTRGVGLEVVRSLTS